MTFAISGATTASAATKYAVTFSSVYSQNGASFVYTGLTAGSTTFKLKYLRDPSGTASFQRRSISVVPL
jgi:hypothetical protein